MITLSKRLLSILLFTAFLAIVGTGCQTANGFGKDMQDAGKDIENGTK